MNDEFLQYLDDEIDRVFDEHDHYVTMLYRTGQLEQQEDESSHE